MNQFFDFSGNTVVGVLAFLGTCFALLVGAVTMVYVVVARKIQFSRVLLLLTVATLFGFSLTGRDLILGLHGSRLP